MARLIRLALYLPFFVLTAQTAPPMPSGPADFCARLAKDSGINPSPASNGPTQWTANAFNFGQRFIVGGTAATAVGVSPLEPATLGDYRRLENMCGPASKGAMCKLVGPLNFNFTWKGRKIVTAMAAGETATVVVTGGKTTCRMQSNNDGDAAKVLGRSESEGLTDY